MADIVKDPPKKGIIVNITNAQLQIGQLGVHGVHAVLPVAKDLDQEKEIVLEISKTVKVPLMKTIYVKIPIAQLQIGQLGVHGVHAVLPAAKDLDQEKEIVLEISKTAKVPLMKRIYVRITNAKLGVVGRHGVHAASLAA